MGADRTVSSSSFLAASMTVAVSSLVDIRGDLESGRDWGVMRTSDCFSTSFSVDNGRRVEAGRVVMVKESMSQR